MQATPEQLVRITPALGPHASALLAAADRYGIKTPLRLAHWLAQMAHESGGFTRFVESLNYKADSKMMRRFIKWGRISEADAQKFGRTADHPAHENALGNILYGGKFGREQLGNTQPGDGWKFRAHGPSQLTGRSNFTRISRRIYGDDRLADHPELALQPEAIWLIAAEFWKMKNLAPRADRDDVEAVTQGWNGGDVGLDDRKEWLVKAKRALGL